jgi:hypothetical protein
MANTKALLRVTVAELRELELSYLLHHGTAVKLQQAHNLRQYDKLVELHRDMVPPFHHPEALHNALMLTDRQNLLMHANNCLEVHFQSAFLLVFNEHMEDLALGDIMLLAEEFVVVSGIFRDLIDLRYFMLTTHMTMDYVEEPDQLPYLSHILNDINSALAIAEQDPLIFSFYSRSTTEAELRDYQESISSFITRIECAQP